MGKYNADVLKIQGVGKRLPESTEIPLRGRDFLKKVKISSNVSIMFEYLSTSMKKGGERRRGHPYWNGTGTREFIAKTIREGSISSVLRVAQMKKPQDPGKGKKNVHLNARTIR